MMTYINFVDIIVAFCPTCVLCFGMKTSYDCWFCFDIFPWSCVNYLYHCGYTFHFVNNYDNSTTVQLNIFSAMLPGQQQLYTASIQVGIDLISWRRSDSTNVTGWIVHGVTRSALNRINSVCIQQQKPQQLRPTAHRSSQHSSIVIDLSLI